VSCVSAAFCQAISGEEAVTWNGTSWSAEPLPAVTDGSYTPNSGAGNNELNRVSCVTAGSCVAVGSAPDPGGYTATLVEATG
jgi:hypothetical protein